MEEHVSIVTQFVNHHLGALALAILSALHIKPENPALPIPEHLVMGSIVLLGVTILGLILKSRLSVEKPGSMVWALYSVRMKRPADTSSISDSAT